MKRKIMVISFLFQYVLTLCCCTANYRANTNYQNGTVASASRNIEVENENTEQQNDNTESLNEDSENQNDYTESLSEDTELQNDSYITAIATDGIIDD